MDAFLRDRGMDRLRIVKTQPNPNRWQAFCRRYDLSWKYTPFKRKLVRGISEQPGLYCFHIGHDLSCLPPWGLSLYGGMTEKSLRKRCMNYFWERDSEEGREHIRLFLKAFKGELSLGWSEVDPTVVDLKALEREFNDAMMPPYSHKDFTADVGTKKRPWQ